MSMGSRKKALRTASALLATAAIIGAGLQPASAYQRPGVWERVSVASDGSQATYPLDFCSLSGRKSDLSASGRYVVFSSSAANLVPGDTNQSCDVFWHDRRTGKTLRVSVASDGSQALPSVHGSQEPTINGSGRYIAFTSDAVNLVPGDTNLNNDIFVHDVKNRLTTRVSVASDGTQANPLRFMQFPSISASGRFVGFDSGADNLVEDDTNNSRDAFVHDRKTKKTVRASVNSKGEEAETGCDLPLPCFGAGGSAPSISATGRYVAFASSATNLVPGDEPPDDDRICIEDICIPPLDDTNLGLDVFVRDMKKGKTMRVSQASDGSSPSFSSNSLGGVQDKISDDGRYVAFYSNAHNLVPNDTNFRAPLHAHFGWDIFTHDLKTRRTERVSVDSNGRERVDRMDTPSINGTGQYITYVTWRCPPSSLSSSAANIADSYLYDRHTGAMEWISAPAKEPGSCSTSGQRPPNSGAEATSHDGRYVSLWSSAEDLVEGDTNNHWDIFVRDRGPALGVGGFGGSPSGGEPPDDDDRICIEDVCLPPLGSVAFADQHDDVGPAVTDRGANLIGGRLTHRAPMGDLYAVLELESMPRTPALAAATAGIVYGVSLKIDGNPFEVRAASTGLGPRGETTADFGLFSCGDEELLCSKISDLKGGFGTTGERITFSVPLNELGVEDESVISEVRAFTALGSFLGGSAKTLDEAKLEKR